MTADGGNWDYIVIGAGSAGAVIANRLSADPRHSVLLLEAGPARNFWEAIPIGYSRLIDNPETNWCYLAEAESGTNGRRLNVPRGRLLGGTSSINGHAFVRGQRQDFDTWAQLGNVGWSYADVLPMYQRMENTSSGSDAYRGRGGPLRITRPPPHEPIFAKMIEAAGQIGIAHNPDYNEAEQDGIAVSEVTIASGRRQSTAHCYLHTIRNRANLRIETGALARAVLLEGSRCVGVRYEVGGEVREVRAAREVVVCGGAINSPQLLELSGIGQPERLRDLGIEVRHAMPGVGENLRDHYAAHTRWTIDSRGYSFNERARGLPLVGEVLKYLLLRRGLLVMAGAPLRAFVRSREGLASPDILLGLVPLSYDFGADGSIRPSRQSGVTLYAHPIRPESHGSVHAASADPRQPPAIRFNFLSAAADRSLAVAAVRRARQVMTAPAMASLGMTEIAPGSAVQSDEDILDWVRNTGQTTYHPVGTCKMGVDDMAVVDPRLRVRGINGLRVADASIMPTITSGNTNAPSIMIGEKAADMILEDFAAWV